MLLKTRAIVISAIRYQEKSLVVKCFTQAEGLRSYYVRDAFGNKKSSQKNIYFRPLSIINIVATHKNKGTLEYFKEVHLAHPYTTLHTDIAKTTIALFVSEVLHHCIKEEEQNEGLYAFLETALLWLDGHDEPVNFHLIVLLELTKFLGFYPNGLESHTFFEMTEGVFMPYASSTCLNDHETLLLRRLMGLKLENRAMAFHITERQALLKILIDYYTIHLDGFRRPRSLDVLKEVFS
ncbi:DNA recombination protein RecO [Flavobacterium akiainvivens]|uniref:DNA repair protein RecO n=1 Tax=Flavobacterium akiainvivens TaxID=1202724 RepID=A0A0M8MJB6_9FLAO|nr:DNA repair protein RecO [Flavobacterium akiainvivens]KOS06987.1 DNA recombination protein RecO [Flavobacterium akiainvivens]SFQ59518.1 DNA replication and repair protein RecO [Flavobacterium akiainvivens]